MRRALRNAWAVLRALITLGVTIECLLLADTKVFTVLIALLILVYLQGLGSANMFGSVVFRDLARLSIWVKEIRERVGITDQDGRSDLTICERIDAKLKEGSFEQFVFLVQVWLMYVIVLSFLIRSLVF